MTAATLSSAGGRLVVVGNGMAGLKLLEEIETTCAGRFEITVVGAEPEPAYNRVLLSSALAGEASAADIEMRPRAWYDERRIKLVTGVAASALAPERGVLALANGDELPFDRLVLATGADPIILPLPGRELDGVITFRTSADVTRMRTATATGRPAVVIGGGLLGIEAAYGLARAGIPVTLVHVMDRLMERQLDADGARLLAAALEAKGIRVMLSTETREIRGSGAVDSIVTKAGDIIPCGLVVMAVGVRPATQLAASGGLKVGRGILVDDTMQTSAAGIYALGDCAEHAKICYGLVEPAYAQARVLAAALAGDAAAAYAGSVLATNLKVSGVPVFSAGDFEGKDAESIILRDEGGPTYRRLVLRDEQLVGAVLVGDTQDALWYADLISTKASVAPFRQDLAFGRAYAEAA